MEGVREGGEREGRRRERKGEGLLVGGGQTDGWMDIQTLLALGRSSTHVNISGISKLCPRLGIHLIIGSSRGTVTVVVLIIKV